MRFSQSIPQSKIAEKLDELDFDFHAYMQFIDTVDEFDSLIPTAIDSKKKVFYRGERKYSLSRPLLPSIYRNREILFDNNKKVNLVSSSVLYDFYRQNCGYFDLYENIIEPIRTDKMYSFLAFSQHYFGISPLIDFTKNLYVALSFALKGRSDFEEDILIYTLELSSDDDYTDSIKVADKWIEDYSVMLFRNMKKHDFETPLETLADYRLIADKFKGHSLLDMNAPRAKLIDVPTNDLIKYQQGVFLLLDDFSLMGKSYLTKKIRDEFSLKKWIISKDICPTLMKRLKENYPYYAYKNITDLSVVASEIKKNNKLYWAR